MSSADTGTSLALVPGPGRGELDRILALVLDSVSSPHTRRAYERALHDFLR